MIKAEDLDEVMLEVLSFFEEMTFEKIILDWPAHMGDVTREEIEESLMRLKKSRKIIEKNSDQGPCYVKKMQKKKRFFFFS